MKKTHIIAIVIIAAAIGVITTSLSNASTYGNFAEAFENPNSKIQIVGYFYKEKELVYEPEIDPNLMSFYMTDKEGKECKVVLNQSKPQDFERSEEIVLKGKVVGDEFHATDMLMKCPSKYNDGSQQVYTD
ncbi:MAG: cytochrome c maturation protein CcmE [Flavobacteriales bacterium]|nr:cytochrome c maturation protein CcmE [Flavobacteriales bacterium]